eukprot:1613973-Rhodomonas_salina.1
MPGGMTPAYMLEQQQRFMMGTNSFVQAGPYQPTPCPDDGTKAIRSTVPMRGRRGSRERKERPEGGPGWYRAMRLLCHVRYWPSDSVRLSKNNVHISRRSTLPGSCARRTTATRRGGSEDASEASCV